MNSSFNSSFNSCVAIWNLGRSAQGRPLEALAIAPGASGSAKPPSAPGMASYPWVLCLGTVHGDEVEGAWLMAEMRSRWLKEYACRNVGVILWEQVNPDGLALAQRGNARGVDLNRNLPTKDWTQEARSPRYFPGAEPGSEPENHALIELIEKCQPKAILSAHSFSQYQLNISGPAKPWAEKLAPICGYPVTEDIGYPTPGCLGAYAGHERNIAVITLEIEHLLPRDKILALHVPLMQAAVEFWDHG